MHPVNGTADDWEFRSRNYELPLFFLRFEIRKHGLFHGLGGL